MPRYGPSPKQFSQAGATPGEPIVASPSVNPAKDAPSYKPEARELYLNQGVFGNPSDEALVNGDTNFPDIFGDFEALDVVTGLDDAQSLDIAYQGRLATLETRLDNLSIFVKGDIATSTGPPQFRLQLLVEGTGLAVYDSGLLDAPSSLTEFTITADTDFTTQPTAFKRYFLIVEAYVSMGQTLQCSRPFVRQE
jgi:hypothetical protein